MAYDDKCPVCGADDFEYEDTEIIDDCMVQWCVCIQCDSEWEEVWAYVETRNVVDARCTEPDTLDQKTIDIIKAWHV